MLMGVVYDNKRQMFYGICFMGFFEFYVFLNQHKNPKKSMFSCRSTYQKKHWCALVLSFLTQGNLTRSEHMSGTL